MESQTVVESQGSLEAARQQLQSILDFYPDAIFIVNQHGKVLVWNKAIEELTGVSRENILGSDGYKHAVSFYGETEPLLIDLALKLRNVSAEYPIQHGPENRTFLAEAFVPELFGGRGGYIQATASPLFESNGKLVGAVEFIRDITGYKRLESTLLERDRSLHEKDRQLAEIHTAFGVLLKRREDDHKELEHSIMANLKESILPHIEKLRKTAIDKHQQDCLTAITNSISDVLSPFLKDISIKHDDLTPMEVQIALLVKEGKSTKEIAELFHIAEKTVSTHRYNLRIKLGLKNRKINLRTYLLSINK
jgi:DNA-binding CsgD family transcriptional regulator